MEESQLLSDQTLGHKLIKKGFWLYFFSFLIAPAGYIVKVLVSNSLSVADVGVLYSILGLITFLNVYNDLGLTESFQYFLPRYRLKKQFNYIKTSLYLSLFAQILTAIIIALFLWFGAPWLGDHYFHSSSAVVVLKYFCFYFLGINLFQVLQSVFIAFQDTFSFQFVDFIRMRSMVAFTFLFFITGNHSIEYYSLNRILGLAIGILISGIIFNKKYKKFVLQGSLVYDKVQLKEYVHYALWCFVGINVGALFGQIIQQLIIVILGAEQAGYYTNFYSLFSLSSVLIGPIMGLIFPMVSELVTKKDVVKLSLLYKFFYTYFSVFSLFLAIFFVALGPELALIFFGKKFLFSGQLTAIGGLFSIFTTLVSFNFAVLSGMGKIKARVKQLLIASGLVTVASIIGLYTIGIYGAILAFGVSYALLFRMSFHLIYADIPFGVDRKFIWKNILLCFFLGIGLYFVKAKLFVIDDVMRYTNLFNFILLCIGSVLVFVLVNWKSMLILKHEIVKMRRGV